MDDVRIVSAQLGRPLICAMTTATRCGNGYPVVIKNAPEAADGSPFPTLYWLTCPVLRAGISKLESSGALADLASLVETDGPTRSELLASDRRYRQERETFGGSTTSLKAGIAGTRDPLHLKCLHAHAADYLAQGINPVGKKVLERVCVPANCDRCAGLCE